MQMQTRKPSPNLNLALAALDLSLQKFSTPLPLPSLPPLTLFPPALPFASQFAYKKSQVAWANASHTGRMRNARITHSEQATAMRLQ